MVNAHDNHLTSKRFVSKIKASKELVSVCPLTKKCLVKYKNELQIIWSHFQRSMLLLLQNTSGLSLCFCYCQRETVKYESNHSRCSLFGVTWQPYVTFTANDSCCETQVSAHSGSGTASQTKEHCCLREREQPCKSNTHLPVFTSVLQKN